MLSRFCHLSLLCLALSILFAPGMARAAEVLLVKKKNVVLKLSEEERTQLSKGDRLMFYDGKKARARIEIVKIKGAKAQAKILKGKVKKNYTAQRQDQEPKQAKKQRPRKDKAAAKGKTPPATTELKKWQFGISGGLHMQTLSINLGVENVSATGMNFAFKGLVQRNWQNFAITGLIGYEGFSSKGEATTNLCNNSTSCETAIDYLSSQIWGKWYISRNHTSFWAGAGSAFNFPLKASSSALNEEGIGLTNLFLIGGGADLKVGSAVVPLWLEFALLPQSETVQGNYIGIKAGYLF